MNALHRKPSFVMSVNNMHYPAFLPITARKDAIVRAIRKNRVVIISGETGSGKTTQIPKMCLEAGRGVHGIIGCTQPRRIAAVSVARRIAEEMGESVGASVGYKIRFEERRSATQRIKVMTDGILLMEAQKDPRLSFYDTIIVDEAHERSANIDFVIGILRGLLGRRKELKVIITSATIDTRKFSQAFNNAPVIEVSGRTYPIEVKYAPIEDEAGMNGDAGYVEAAVQAAEDLLYSSYGGDILVFMPTERDIMETCELLEGRFGQDAAVLPMFARLTWTRQQRIFQTMPIRKVIVATNVAETSITIPGIRYVIDTGLARILEYNPRSRTTSLHIKEISKSSADQRKGRCGRMENGICIRLYAREDYEDRPDFTPPEILRTSLAEVILRMVSLGLVPVDTFPFIDAPPPKAIRSGIEMLQELGAVQVSGRMGPDSGISVVLTERGRLMARLPLDPRLSRMIIEAIKEGCPEEVKIIASSLSIQDPRERPAGREGSADIRHKAFRDGASDFMTILNIWRHYQQALKTAASKNQVRKFCRENFLSMRRMQEWKDVYEQISDLLRGERVKERKENIPRRNARETADAIHRSILSGFLSNIAQRKEKNIYLATKGREAMIFPGSALFGAGAEWIVAAEMVETSRLFARMTANIDSKWIEELGGGLCRSAFSEPRWDEKRGEVIADEQVSLFGLVIVPKRRASYGRIDPEVSSQIFIRSALVEGRIKKPFPFMVHNRLLIERVRNMEDKLRRRNLLVSEDRMAAFYEDRLRGVCDTRTLQKLLLDRKDDGFLRMSEEDLLLSVPEEDELSLYPDEVVLDRLRYRCFYRFEPSGSDDGITVKVPFNALSLVPEKALDWQLPGLLREKISALVKGLPKEYRRRLQPLSGTCRIILEEIDERDAHLCDALSRFIRKRFGVDIPPKAWPLASMEEHLKIRYSVVDENDREVLSGRDIKSLRGEAAVSGESRAFKDLKARWERTGITSWDFGDLPEYVTSASPGSIEEPAFPALIARGESVDIMLFGMRGEAAGSHVKGVGNLYSLHFAEELRHLRKGLVLQGEIKSLAAEFAGVKVFEKLLYDKVIKDLFERNIRTQEEYFRHAEAARPLILPAGQMLIKRAFPLLRAYQGTAGILRKMGDDNRFNKPALDFASRLMMNLKRLLPDNFLELYGEERLADIMRYCRALGIRAQRGVIHLEKDEMKERELTPFTEWHAEQMIRLQENDADEKRRALEEYRWLIEEFRVSVFAQEIKTPYPVSKKRLLEKKQEIEQLF